MRTDRATRDALAAVGKQAATVGGVIHLQRHPDRSARTAEIVAHELVHVAHPSPRPRFFDDDRHSGEEALARATGGMARALVAPSSASPARRRSEDHLTWGTQGLAVGALGSALRVFAGDGAASGARRRTAPPVSPKPTTRPSMIESTADLFRKQGRSVAPEPLLPVRQPDPDYPRPGDAPIIRRFQTSLTDIEAPASAAQVGTSDAPVSAETFEWLLDALEQRVIDELERRGRRHDPGVF